MGNVQALSQQQIQEQLSTRQNWSVQADKLHAEFRFADFIAAFAFMTKVALAAESAQHHPEWSNVYNRVTIDLVTHDAGNAISQRDIDLARKIDSFAS